MHKFSVTPVIHYVQTMNEEINVFLHAQTISDHAETPPPPPFCLTMVRWVTPTTLYSKVTGVNPWVGVACGMRGTSDAFW